MMKLKNKTIDNNKNKCKACSKEICIDDIIIRKSLLCHECNNIISKIGVDDIEYDFYKERIKTWLLSKYNILAWGS